MSAPVPPNRSNQKAPGGLTSSIPPYDGRIAHAGSIYGSCFRRLRHPIPIPESIKNLYKERNGQLLQDVWIVTRQPSTVTVFFRTHLYHNLSRPLFMVPSPTWTYIIDEPPIFHPLSSHFAHSDHNCDLRQFRSDVWNAISTGEAHRPQMDTVA